jgi:ubiquinone/menaquinone biosynthesis C-methylase UbiE
MDLRLQHEIDHGKKIVDQAGEVWNWETPAGKKRWERRVEMLTAHILPTMQVLEIGCGTGYFTKELKRTGANILAVDISPDLLERAKREVGEGNVSFRIENAYELASLENKSFDTIVGSSVLHHLEIKKALTQFYRVLKPGGTLFFTEPNMLNPQIAVQKNVGFIKQRLGDSPDETAFFRWQLERLLGNYGFSAIKVVPFDFLHPAIPEKYIGLVTQIGEVLEKTPLVRQIAGSLYLSCQKKS